VHNGGNYLGFCGGAGLATMDGIGLLNIKRMPTKQRVPSFSGRIYLNINEHPIWGKAVEQQGSPESRRLSEAESSRAIDNNTFTTEDNVSRITHHASRIFHAWWPSQFLIDDKKIKILATYGDALPDAFSSDLNVGDTESNCSWSEMEDIYKINLNPLRLKNEAAVVEGDFGKGKVVLSLIHFDTPGDENGARVLKNLWEYLTKNSYEFLPPQPPLTKGGDLNVKEPSLFTDGAQQSRRIRTALNVTLLEELESAVKNLIDLGIRNFLWFWKNLMLLQWRRGVRGLEYCTLYIMIKEVAEIIKKGQGAGGEEQEIENSLRKIKELFIPFIKNAKQLLILERYAMQSGHITYEKCDDPKIQKMRTELFGNSKSHGGLFKKLIDEVDNVLYTLLKTRRCNDTD
jgi:hypothetical protein